MSEIKLILTYQIKIKLRESKTLFKNLYQTIIPMFLVVGYFVFQAIKMILANLKLINTYQNQVFLGLSILMLVMILMAKKIPLQWHPASMIYLLGSNLRLVFKISLLKKGLMYTTLSVFIAFALNNFRFSFQMLQMLMSLCNLLIISLMSRHFIYHQEASVKKLGFILSYMTVLNLQLYINKYVGIILIIFLTYITVLSIRCTFKTNINIDKSFRDLIFINRVNYISREMMMGDMQELTRETQSEKHKKLGILNIIQFKNPLNQKNLITFSRINLTVSIILVTLLMIVVVLYRVGIFELVKIIRDLELGLPIVVLHQTTFVTNMVMLITQQKDLLITKSKQGLYLPYKRHEILKSFVLLGAPILCVVTLLVGLILQKSLGVIAAASLLYSMFLIFTLYFKKGRGSMILENLLMMIVLGISYLWIGLL